MFERSRTAFLATTLLLAAGPAALAEPDPAMPGPPMQPMMHGSHHGAGAMGMPGGRWAGPAFARIDRLELSDEQRSKIRKLESDLRRKNWDTLGKIMDEKDKLHDLYAADKRDPKAIGAVYGTIFGYQRQIIEATVDTLNRAEAMLTDAQRQQLKQLRRGPRPQGAMPGMGPGAPQGPAPR